MWFETRKQLKERIRQLERRIETIHRENGIIREANLPKCESELCRACIHCKTVYNNSWEPIVGCTKHLDCKDFEAAQEH